MTRLSGISLTVFSGLLLLGAIEVLFPNQVLLRTSDLLGDPSDSTAIVRGMGIMLLAAGIAILAADRDRPILPAGVAWPVMALLYSAAFWIAGSYLQNWWIDDAGITFAYSRALGDGMGLVAQAGQAPEEGYSSSLWMLFLATAHWAGFDIADTAKYTGMVWANIALILMLDVLRRRGFGPEVAALAATGLLTTPFIVWSVSGQEHALQCLLLTLIVWIASRTENWRLPVSGVLVLLVLCRPEAPLIVVAVAGMGVWVSFNRTGRLELIRNLPLAALPFVAWLALIGFRLAYFGDPLPNPYYAKTSNAGFQGLVNPFGGGWQYIFEGLRDTGLLMLMPALLMLRAPRGDTGWWITFSVVGASLVFVIWAKGDWMAQYRFLMPFLPLFMLCIAAGFVGLFQGWMRALFLGVAVIYLQQATVMELNRFGDDPTTPIAEVSDIGQEFASLADRLGIEDPVLAHHDAGGIVYMRWIKLIDLGGLVDRQIAKNMNNRAFLTQYLLEEKRPDFFFGANNFAIRSNFWKDPAFARDYVRLDFPGKPWMRAQLVHIRRDHVADIPGLEAIPGDDGRAGLIRITDPG